MTVFFHELRQGRISLAIWAAIISFMLGVCILIYPEMSSQMNEMSQMFSDMGSFSAAFGMDELNFGEFKGYFGIECGNVLGIGGAIFAALLGISALGKEESEGTAEFLLTHPISRLHIMLQKLAAIAVQVLILNLLVAAMTVASIALVGESMDTKLLFLLFLAYTLMQLEIACVTFSLSACIRKGGVAMGLGLSIGFYFCNIVSNLTEDAKFLKYLTPFGYTDSARIINETALQTKYVLCGIAIATVSCILACIYYRKKDIS